jgi:hypothetical protein
LRYINRGRDTISIEMSSFNDTPTFELHTTKCWSLCLLLGSAIVYILNFLVVQRVFAASPFFGFKGCWVPSKFSSCQHHSQSLLLSDRLAFPNAINRISRLFKFTLTMKSVGILSLSFCMQSVYALPQGSINSQAPEVSNSLPTATFPITTVFTSSVPLVQSTSTNAVPDTTGVSLYFWFLLCSHWYPRLNPTCNNSLTIL